MTNTSSRGNSGSKHIMCRHYEKTGTCHYKGCKFAHSRREQSCNKLPCWFYNHGGCKKVDCEFLHIPAISGSKTQGPLEDNESSVPCWYYHIIGDCKTPKCKWSHSPLSDKQWDYYFPHINKRMPISLESKTLNDEIINIKQQITNIKKSKLREYIIQEIIKDVLKQFVTSWIN